MNSLIDFHWILQNPHFVMHRPTYSVGQGRQCDLWIGEPSVSKSLCNLKHIEQEVNLTFLDALLLLFEVV